MQKNLDTRIAHLEGQAGIGSKWPTSIIIAAFCAGDFEELQHASTSGAEGLVELHREPGESLKAFELRAKQLAHAERNCVPVIVMWP